MCESWPFKTHGISLPLWHWLEQSRQINQENAGISPRTSPQSRRKCDVGFHQSGGAGKSGGMKDSDESWAIITVFLLSSSWKINLIIPWCKWYQSAWRRMPKTSKCGLSDKYEDFKACPVYRWTVLNMNSTLCQCGASVWFASVYIGLFSHAFQFLHFFPLSL